MRLLLVDDEVRLLDSLRRALRVERPGWRISVAPCGEAGLGLLQAEPFDVMVTDMMMPGMDGAEVLREARRLSPATARIVLSGHASQDRIQACEGAFHQFMGKPVEPGAFMALLDGFDPAGLSPARKRARELVAGMDRVPSLPEHLDRLFALLEEGPAQIDQVALLARQDLGVAARVLKLANTGVLDPARRVSDLDQAVRRMGPEALRRSLRQADILEPAPSLRPSGLDLEGLWNHSTRVAAAAERIAELQGQGPQVRARCHTAGLLHDLGRALLAAGAAGGYDRLVAEAAGSAPLLESLERRVYGINHAEIGAELLHLWGLDPEVVAAVRHHHQPEFGPATGFSLPLAVHCADAWASRQPGCAFFDGGAAPRPAGDPRRQAWLAALETPPTP